MACLSAIGTMKSNLTGSAALPANRETQCHWVKPQLVAQVKFAGWTRAGRLRQPVFAGLRQDKPAAQVVRESARPQPLPDTNRDKVFYPKTGFTKGEVLDYYREMAPVLLPHLRGRPITLKRYPDGVEGSFFYEKRCPAHAPEWIRTTRVEKSDGSTIHYCLLDDLPSLIWAVNLGNLEIHPFLHRAGSRPRPTVLMFDLDPGAPADVLDCCRTALWIRNLFLTLHLQSFVKTSGADGLQLVVPLNGSTTYETTKSFARAVARALASRFPGEVTADMGKILRKGKVFIDWSQNDAKKTTVSPYSLRAQDVPSVSTPLKWEEVENAQRKMSSAKLNFMAAAVIKRVSQLGDLFSKVLTLKQQLPPFHQEGM